MIYGVLLILSWCVAMVAAGAVPVDVRIVWVLGAVAVFGCGSLLCESRSGAIAEAAAPSEQRGVYLAAFQYSFTAAQLLAPLLVSLFAIGTWVPWSIVASALMVGAVTIARLSRSMPAQAVHILPASGGQPPLHGRSGVSGSG
jgi:phosphatidylglycerophosphate synthase